MNNMPNNIPPPENVQQNLDTNTDQVKVDTNVAQEQSPPIDPLDSGDPNWKAAREARKKERQEREAAEKRAKEEKERADALTAALEVALNKPQRHQREENPYHTPSWDQQEETEEQRIERKVAEVIAKKEAEYEQQRKQIEAEEFPKRLQKDHANFLETVSDENLHYLEYHYPEVAGPLNSMPQGYDRWSAIYKAVKRFVPNTNTKKDVVKAENNFNKPKSMSTVNVTERGDSPYPIHISEEKKRANWERMQRDRYKVS